MPTAQADTFTNNTFSTIAGGSGGSGTSFLSTDNTLLLATGTGVNFPSGTSGPFYILIGTLNGLWEICKVTTRSTDTLSGITRGNVLTGPDHTTNRTWGVGTLVQQTLTAGAMTDLWTRVQQAPYNVRDFLATGNGTTDDTLALQNTCDAARLAGGGAIYIPAGTYLVHLTVNPNVAAVSAAMHVGSNCTVYGDGPENTVIKLANASAQELQRVISNWNPQSSGTDIHIRLRDFSCNGNALNQTTVVNLDHCDGLNFQYVRDLQLTNIVSKNHFGTTGGANGPGGASGESHQILVQHCLDVSIIGCEAFQDDGGASISSGIALSESFNIQISHCTAHDLEYGNGFPLFALNGLQMTGCIAYGINAVGAESYLFELCSYFTVSACQGGAIVQASYQAGPLAGGTTLTQKYGMQFNGCSHGTVNGCLMEEGTVSGFNLVDEVSPATPNTDLTFTGCVAGNNTSHGFAVQGTAVDITFVGCIAHNNASKGFYNLSTGTAGRVKFIGCRAINNTGAGFQVDGTAPHFTDIISCESLGNGSVASFGGTTYTAITGPLTAPAVPATTVSLTNPFPFPVQVIIVGGTVTVINVSGTVTGLTSGSVRIASNGTITLTYTAAPTWTWYGD